MNAQPCWPTSARVGRCCCDRVACRATRLRATLPGAVGHLFSDSRLGFYRRRMALEGFARGRSGVINVVQRVASDMKLAPLHHAIGLDGVYTDSASGELAFHALPRLRTDEVADVLQTVRIRVVGLLQRRGLLEHDDENQLVLRGDDAFAESEPALSRLAHTAVGTQPPSGPELRRRIARALPERPASPSPPLYVSPSKDSRCTPPHVLVRTTRARASDSCATCFALPSQRSDCGSSSMRSCGST